MSQQLLSILPEQFLLHLRLEVVQRLKVFEPALWCDKGIVGAKEETVLLRGGYEPLLPYLKQLQVNQLVLEYATPHAEDRQRWLP